MSTNLSLVALSYTGKKLKHCTEKVLLLITRSSEQCGGFHTTYEYLDFDEYTCSIVFCYDILDSNHKPFDPFFTEGRHEELNVYVLHQSFFDIPKEQSKTAATEKFQ